MKTVAIMQPYFLPYIGYFQLIASADLFIVYDNIKYTKKGWINRNRLLLNGRDATFSLPLKSDSDYLNINERTLSCEFDRKKLLNQFKAAYLRAPYFSQTFPLLEQILQHEDNNLFRFLHHSLIKVCHHLSIPTEIVISSDIAIDHALKGQDKVLALCQAVGATHYINAIGGTELYDINTFQNKEIELNFIQSKFQEYAQFGNEFVPWLSIVDVMMFNSPAQLQNSIRNGFDLI